MNDRNENSGRDEELGRHFDRLVAPEHRDGFWNDLRADIARTPAGARAAAESARAGDSSDEESATVVPLTRVPEPAAGRARRARIVLAAAAAFVLVAVGAAVAAILLEDDGGDEAITAGPDTSDEPAPVPDGTPAVTPTTAVPDGGDSGDGDPSGGETVVDWTTVAEDTVVGPGRLIAASPDGRWLYVSDLDPDGGLGCEGVERRTLFVYDVETGERRLADAGITNASGGLDIVIDGSGRAAILEQCEGFAGRLAVAQIGAGGLLSAPVELSVEALGEFVPDLAWSRDGDLLVSSATFGPDGETRRLLRVDPTSGSVIEVIAEDVVVFGELPSGGVIAGTTSGVRIPDARVIDRATPYGIVVSPDATLAAIQGPDVVELVDVATGEAVSATASDGEAGASGVWAPDGRAYLATFIQLDTVTSRRLVSIDPSGSVEPTAVLGGMDFGEIAVIGADRFAYSSWVDDLGNSEVHIVTFAATTVSVEDPADDVVASSLEGVADATLPTTLIPDGPVTLTDGAFFRGAPGDAQFAEVALRTPVFTADVDDDGLEDALVVLDAGFGGSGITSELIVLLARDGGFVVASEPIPLGDDIRIEGVFDPAEGPVVHGPGVEFIFDTRAEGTPRLEFDIRRILLLEVDDDGVVLVVDTINEPIEG
ncbi:MAG: hypothetical protein RIE08_07145 [Acidimicrobiales bacterium]